MLPPLQRTVFRWSSTRLRPVELVAGRGEAQHKHNHVHKYAHSHYDELHNHGHRNNNHSLHDDSRHKCWEYEQDCNYIRRGLRT
mmetsp:Transcript_27213/g.71855  ORF Transcript_27213/g.71855 Transcript_27213/m.71855 type:complete len:84 (+) Transcript_27213:1946-2197(+)